MPTEIIILFKIKDPYNFEEIRTIKGDIETFIKTDFSFGNLANDIGFLSQADGVISPYTTHINFQKIIVL